MKRYWTEDEDAIVELMAQAGKPAQAIARKLKRPIHAVYYRHNLSRLRAGTTWARGEVARLFGVNDKKVVNWQARGWLPRTRNGAYAAMQGRHVDKNAHYLITDAAIEAFITNRDTWVAWSPDSITDPDLRAYAREMRQLSGGRWLTTAEVAARFGYSTATASEWCRCNRLGGAVRTVKYGSAWFFWSADLDRWQPPDQRRYWRPAQTNSAPEQPSDAPRAILGPDGSRLRWRTYRALACTRHPITAAQLAELIGVSHSAAGQLLSRLCRRGWLTREIDPIDARRYRYRLCVAWEASPL